MPSWKELKRFCEKDGWELYKTTDHYFFRKSEADGSIRKTKSSMGTGEIPQKLWLEILKKQLQTTADYFNSKI
jgi:hypothetical protein